jgi:hypothetical protein
MLLSRKEAAIAYPNGYTLLVNYIEQSDGTVKGEVYFTSDNEGEVASVQDSLSPPMSSSTCFVVGVDKEKFLLGGLRTICTE